MLGDDATWRAGAVALSLVALGLLCVGCFAGGAVVALLS